jgi:ABC-2 type transport system ATP-binding protein
MPSPTAVQDGLAAHRPAGTVTVAGVRSGSHEHDSDTVAVQLRDVHKSFGSVQAVHGVNLSIRCGEVLAFLGPNGAGKTSTIDMILGLSQPTSGQVEVYGMTPRRAISKGLVSAVMQSGGLLKDFTVAETVLYTSKLFAVSRPVGEVLQRAGIGGIADRLVGKCSGGEQQRLRFAMALLPDPELLLLDEPTQGMDVEGRREFWQAIRDDAEQGRTIVFATHYLEEADAYADRVVFISKGRIVADGTAAEVKALAAGRSIRATLPGATHRSLRAIAGVDDVEIRGDSVLIHSSDSDAIARHLLSKTAAHDLEITSRGLEDAFIALTSDPPTEPANRRATQ